MGWIIYVTIRDTAWNTVELDEYDGAYCGSGPFVPQLRRGTYLRRPM